MGPQCGSRTLLRSIHSATSTSPSSVFTTTSPTSRPPVSSLLPSRQHPALRPPCNPRSFTSSSRLLAHHFDTHKFVRRLETEGLTRQQAEGIMNAIENVMDESIRNMSTGFVTKAAQEKVTHTLSFQKITFHLYLGWPPQLATLYPASRLCSTQIRSPARRKERHQSYESRE